MHAHIHLLFPLLFASVGVSPSCPQKRCVLETTGLGLPGNKQDPADEYRPSSNQVLTDRLDTAASNNGLQIDRTELSTQGKKMEEKKTEASVSSGETDMFYSPTILIGS